jgi:dTMP kinase
MSDAPDRRGCLVVLCGIDGSGKATQAGLLASRVEATGRKVRQVSFPRYGEGFFGNLIERYLRGEFAARAGDVSPYLAALPYACDRWEAAPALRRWLAEGRFVLCNRYVPANQAHQGSKLHAEEEQSRFFQWVEQLEYGVFKLPRPDLHLLLDMPAELALGLLQGRQRRPGVAEEGDIHERDMAYQEATARAYRALAAGAPDRWAIVACAEGRAVLPPQVIAEAVWAKARSILYNAG